MTHRAVTRSMTRNALIAQNYPTPEEMASQVEAENAVAPSLPAIHDSITCKGTHRGPATHDSLASSRKNMQPPSTNSNLLPENLLTQNRMTLLQLEQTNALAEGILTITSSGELVLAAAFSVEPDNGTNAGYLGNREPSPDVESQIPTWLREYLLKELNVHGHGPPANCRAFYDRLKDSREDYGQNHTVRTAEGALAYAAISLKYAIKEVRSFAACKYVLSEEAYEEEVGEVVKNVKAMVGYREEEVSTELRLLLSLAGMGPAMKEALSEPLESLVVGPYTRLVERLEIVSKALRVQLDHVDAEAETARKGGFRTPDSGISGCWT